MPQRPTSATLDAQEAARLGPITLRQPPPASLAVPPIGADVSHLMAPPIGADVSHLMNDLSAPSKLGPITPRRTWTDTAVDALPAVGGTVGGIVGGIGGTVAGLGVGGVPGGIGGAALGGAAGEAARQLVNRARGKDAPATMTEAAKDIGIQGGVQGATEAIGGVLGKGLEVGGTALYRGYLKPSLASAEVAKAKELVATGIREWLPVTEWGKKKAARLIGELNTQVEGALKASGANVDLHQIAERVRAFAQRTYGRPGSPTADFEAAMKVANDIDAHPSLGLPAGAKPTRVDVSPVQANEVKRGLDRAIGDTGFGVERTAATEARKAGRYETRKAIEAKVLGVGELTARESKLIDAFEALEKATAREANKNPLTGWGTTIVAGGVGGAAYGASGDPVKGLMWALTVKGAISPTVATNAGIIFAKLGQSPLIKHSTSAMMRTALVMAQRQEDQANSETRK